VTAGQVIYSTARSIPALRPRWLRERAPPVAMVFQTSAFLPHRR